MAVEDSMLPTYLAYNTAVFNNATDHRNSSSNLNYNESQTDATSISSSAILDDQPIDSSQDSDAAIADDLSEGITVSKPQYHCTLEGCNKISHNASEFQRHEKNKGHYNQERYISPFTMQESLEDHYRRCLPALVNQPSKATFTRTYHLTKHLVEKHGYTRKDANAGVNGCKYFLNNNWPRECKLCDVIFTTLEERNKHILWHYKRGETWPKADRGQDDESDDEDDDSHTGGKPPSKGPKTSGKSTKQRAGKSSTKSTSKGSSSSSTSKSGAGQSSDLCDESSDGLAEDEAEKESIDRLVEDLSKTRLRSSLLLDPEGSLKEINTGSNKLDSMWEGNPISKEDPGLKMRTLAFLSLLRRYIQEEETGYDHDEGNYNRPPWLNGENELQLGEINFNVDHSESPERNNMFASKDIYAEGHTGELLRYEGGKLGYRHCLFVECYITPTRTNFSSQSKVQLTRAVQGAAPSDELTPRLSEYFDMIGGTSTGGTFISKDIARLLTRVTKPLVKQTFERIQFKTSNQTPNQGYMLQNHLGKVYNSAQYPASRRLSGVDNPSISKRRRTPGCDTEPGYIWWTFPRDLEEVEIYQQQPETWNNITQPYTGSSPGFCMDIEPINVDGLEILARKQMQVATAAHSAKVIEEFSSPIGYHGAHGDDPNRNHQELQDQSPLNILHHNSENSSCNDRKERFEKIFKPGSVFKVLWSEPSANKGVNRVLGSCIKSSDTVYTKPRRFVVLKPGRAPRQATFMESRNGKTTTLESTFSDTIDNVKSKTRTRKSMQRLLFFESGSSTKNDIPRHLKDQHGAYYNILSPPTATPAEHYHRIKINYTIKDSALHYTINHILRPSKIHDLQASSQQITSIEPYTYCHFSIYVTL
ncbi:hypothetical protein M7I_3602 [Glarea lozoyensis 74030]|uniref:C2H2-type domain-containing protein n=1 Tax=Glarea lozoyensis (strain ATCC 74030 / MF5533) TaxID=1104152 RepID=H0ELX9_GLAL7|nr:hypothetical protein M7I_3602 [Glarea lozoyensis 74030]